MERENCQIERNASVLAKREGLDASKVVCSTINLCDGSFCIYQAAVEKIGPPLEEVKSLAEQFPEYRRILLQDVDTGSERIEKFDATMKKHQIIYDSRLKVISASVFISELLGEQQPLPYQP